MDYLYFNDFGFAVKAHAAPVVHSLEQSTALLLEIIG